MSDLAAIEQARDDLASAMARQSREPTGAFPAQQAFIDDQGPFLVAFCTRRASKSYSAGLKAFKTAQRIPKCSVLIAGLARLEVKRIWWIPILKDIADRYGIDGMRWNETELTATLPNGSIIYLLGMDANEKEKRKALGQKFPLVIIDEAQDFVTDLNALVYHVLKPAVADYRGTICMLGTPGLIAKGLFYEATKPEGRDTSWTMHEWTTFDNVAIAPDPNPNRETCAQRWASEIEDLKAAKPGIEETPAFRRNYLREWVVDEDARVYKYRAGRNDFDGVLPFPASEWHYILGVDLGHHATAFVVAAYHDHSPNLYFVHADKAKALDLTDTANRAKALDRKYSFDAWLVDGAAKQSVEEMRRRHDCPWKAADKTDKRTFIELMNADFICGTIKLGPDCAKLKSEYASLIWDPKSIDNGKPEEHSACENHDADAGLYSWRHCIPYLSTQKPVIRQVGTSEWQQQQQEEMREQAEREIMQRREERAEQEMFG